MPTTLEDRLRSGNTATADAARLVAARVWMDLDNATLSRTSHGRAYPYSSGKKDKNMTLKPPPQELWEEFAWTVVTRQTAPWPYVKWRDTASVAGRGYHNAWTGAKAMSSALILDYAPVVMSLLDWTPNDLAEMLATKCASTVVGGVANTPRSLFSDADVAQGDSPVRQMIVAWMFVAQASQRVACFTSTRSEDALEEVARIMADYGPGSVLRQNGVAWYATHFDGFWGKNNTIKHDLKGFCSEIFKLLVQSCAPDVYRRVTQLIMVRPPVGTTVAAMQDLPVYRVARNAMSILVQQQANEGVWARLCGATSDEGTDGEGAVGVARIAVEAQKAMRSMFPGADLLAAGNPGFQALLTTLGAYERNATHESLSHGSGVVRQFLHMMSTVVAPVPPPPPLDAAVPLPRLAVRAFLAAVAAHAVARTAVIAPAPVEMVKFSKAAAFTVLSAAQMYGQLATSPTGQRAAYAAVVTQKADHGRPRFPTAVPAPGLVLAADAKPHIPHGCAPRDAYNCRKTPSLGGKTGEMLVLADARCKAPAVLRSLTMKANGVLVEDRHVWDVLRALYLGAAQGLTPAAVAALRTEAFKNPYGPWANDEAGNMADIAEDVAAFTAASHMDALGRQTLLCEVSPAFAAHLHTLPEGEAEGVLRGTVAAITVVLKRLLNRWAVLRGRGPFQDFTNQHDRAFDGSFDSGARGGCGVAASIVPLSFSKAPWAAWSASAPSPVYFCIRVPTDSVLVAMTCVRWMFEGTAAPTCTLDGDVKVNNWLAECVAPEAKTAVFNIIQAEDVLLNTGVSALAEQNSLRVEFNAIVFSSVMDFDLAAAGRGGLFPQPSGAELAALHARAGQVQAPLPLYVLAPAGPCVIRPSVVLSTAFFRENFRTLALRVYNRNVNGAATAHQTLRMWDDAANVLLEHWVITWRAARYGGPQPFMEGTAATSLSAIMQMLEDMVSTDTAPSLRTLPHGKVFTTFIGPAGARIQVPWYYPFVCVLLRRLPVSAPAA